MTYLDRPRGQLHEPADPATHHARDFGDVEALGGVPHPVLARGSVGGDGQGGGRAEALAVADDLWGGGWRGIGDGDGKGEWSPERSKV